MKKIYLFLLSIFFLNLFSLNAQNTDGTDFWVTFGGNYLTNMYNANQVNLQIRIVSRDNPTWVKIEFTETGYTETYSLPANKVETINLGSAQKLAAYNNYSSTTQNQKSIHITSGEPITAYAMNAAQNSTDATNILPITALGNEYYQISYRARSNNVRDAYAVIATEPQTQIRHNGALVTTLVNVGDVYYRTSASSNPSMTGAHVEADKPVAFFALCQGAFIPYGTTLGGDHLMQQLSPVNTWGKKFFVPVSGSGPDRVRVVASKSDTYITLNGGTLITSNVENAKTTLADPLGPGDYVEIEVNSTNSGCYIHATERIGVCTYLKSQTSGGSHQSDPAQAWLPAIEQTAPEAMLAPFIPDNSFGGNSMLTPGNGGKHFALIITPTATKTNTEVFENKTPKSLVNANWKDNTFAGMSYYLLQLTNDADIAYEFFNPAKLLVMGYGIGDNESYYYLGFSAQRDLDVTFSIDDENIWEEDVICKHSIIISAEIDDNDVEDVTWDIDGERIEDFNGLFTWPYELEFPTGNYIIQMNYTLDGPRTFTRTLKIGGEISASESPAGWGNVTGTGCFEAGTTATLTATPSDYMYRFLNWTNDDGISVSTDQTISFTVTGDSTLTANFELNTFNVNLSATPSIGGTTSPDLEDILYGTEITVTASPEDCYNFINWTANGNEVETELDFTFIITSDTTLVANFEIKKFTIDLSEDPSGSGWVSGGGLNIDCGKKITVRAFADPYHNFVNWTENGDIVSPTVDYEFTVSGDRFLVANFEPKKYNITLTALVGGSVSGNGTNIPYGESFTAEAFPDTHYKFGYWSEAENGLPVTSDNPYIIPLVNRNLNLIAHFIPETYTITVISDPKEGGLAFSNGTTFNFYDDVIVWVEETFIGYAFAGWTKDGVPVSIQERDTFKVTESCTYVANFVKKSYEISVEANPKWGGIVSVLGDKLFYVHGEEVTVSAKPAPEFDPIFEFVNWTENGVWASDSANYTFTVTCARHLVANFKYKTYEVIVEANPDIGGEVTGGGIYSHGDKVVVSAEAYTGYSFINWTEEGVPQSSVPDYDFNITDSRLLTANFELKAFKVNLSANPHPGGDVDADIDITGFIPYNTLITVYAYPKPNYHFVNWTENGDVINGAGDVYQFPVINNHDLVANFEKDTYDIVLLSAPPQAGTLGADIPLTNIPHGTQITVFATPNNPFFTFLNWTDTDGIVVSPGPNSNYTFTVTGPDTLVANFKAETHLITVSADPDAGGSVSGGGTYEHDAEITISASTDECYDFLYWTEADTIFSYETDFQIIVDSDRDFVAVFEIKNFMVTALPNPEEGGTISMDNVPMDTVYIDCGDKITLIATPEIGYRFVGWTENGIPVHPLPSYTFDVKEPHHLIANFEYVTCTITLLVDPPFTGTAETSGVYPLGSEITVHATPFIEYQFVNWTENGKVASIVADYTFIVEGDRELTAHFDWKTFEVTISADPTYGGDVDADIDLTLPIPYNTEITVYAYPRANYHFVNWTEDGVVIPGAGDVYQFPVINNHNLVAHFEEDTYEIILLVNPSQAGTTGADYPLNDVPHGTQLTIFATPLNGFFTFLNWSRKDGTIVSPGPNSNYTFTVIGPDTLVANFLTETFDITLLKEPDEGGTVACDMDLDDIPYLSLITITATPDPCYDFVCWMEADTVFTYEPEFQIIVDAERTFTAVFEIKTVMVTAIADPDVGGTVSIDTVYIDCGEFTVTATPEIGYRFINWTVNGDVGPTNPVYTAIFTDTTHLIANFEYVTYVINLYPSPFGHGTAYESGVYPLGYELTVHAQANPGYMFLHWTEEIEEELDTVSTIADYTFIVDRDRDLTAHFTTDSLDVILFVNPMIPLGGTVVGGGLRIPYGEWTDILATPEPHFEFVNWTIKETGAIFKNDASYSFPVIQSLNLVANFKINKYEITLTPNPTSGGDVEGAGSYDFGTSITVTAIPALHYDFDNWTENDGVVWVTEDYPFTVEGPRDLVANFTPKNYTINLYMIPGTGAGTVEGAGIYAYNTLATIIAVPAEFYTFYGWTYEDGTLFSPEDTCKFLVAGNLDLWANFTIDTYSVSVTADPEPGGTVSGIGSGIPRNTPWIISAIANSHYSFAYWTSEGEDQPVPYNPHNFIVTCDTAWVAHFTPNNYEVTVSASVGGTAYGAGFFPYLDLVTVWAEADDGYHFKYWKEGEEILPFGATYQFIIEGDRDLIAIFEKNTYTIYVSANPSTGCWAAIEGGGTEFEHDTYITLLSGSNEFYTFDNWTEEETGNVIAYTQSFDYQVTHSCHLIANYIANSYTITLIDDPSGSGLLSGGGVFTYGATTTILAEPEICYDFVEWKEAGTTFSLVPQFTITVEGDRTFYAIFSKQPLTITTSATPPEGGTVSEGYEALPCGTEITVHAYPEMGYILEKWTINGDSVFNEVDYTFTPMESCELVAHFLFVTRKITLIANPNDAGSVSGGGDHPVGKEITVSAMEKPEYTFVNWTEDGEEVFKKADYKFVVENDRILYANFRPSTLDIILTAEPPEGGTVEGGGENFEYGTMITVYAYANNSYDFVGWKEDGSIVYPHAEYRFPVTCSRNLVACFELKKFNITLSADPVEGGTVEGGGENIPCDSVITVNAIPNPNCYFTYWTEGNDTVSSIAKYSFTVKKNRTLVANFIESFCNITVSANPEEGGIVWGGGTDIPNGQTITVSAQANEDYEFLNWTLGDEVVSENLDYPFKVTKSCHLVANFKMTTFLITVSAEPIEYGTVSGGGEFPFGKETTVSATPYQGYIFENWTEAGKVVSTDAKYTFTVNEARNLVANFELFAYTVNVEVNDSDFGEATGGGKYQTNEIAHVFAIANTGYSFANWTINDSIVSVSEEYEFSVIEDITIVANFYALDFDTYAATLWDNTFMLNLNKLAAKNYNIVGCKWFKNGVEEEITNTINEFSYSAGPNSYDKLDLDPNYYYFRLTTKNGSILYSTKKILNEYHFEFSSPNNQLFVYPNPAWAGSSFTIEGTVTNTPIEVFNQYGVCLSRTVATGAITTLTLDLPVGLYFIRNDNKEAKIAILRR
ncbi:MAG: InlB B-repeat-containing protein [Bacteroidales bacterium]|jgi:hypothetical protein|nr:InlB B-repeat-containing protein [Bacteroidales bacterium]